MVGFECGLVRVIPEMDCLKLSVTNVNWDSMWVIALMALRYYQTIDWLVLKACNIPETNYWWLGGLFRYNKLIVWRVYFNAGVALCLFAMYSMYRDPIPYPDKWLRTTIWEQTTEIERQSSSFQFQLGESLARPWCKSFSQKESCLRTSIATVELDAGLSRRQ